MYTDKYFKLAKKKKEKEKEERKNEKGEEIGKLVHDIWMISKSHRKTQKQNFATEISTDLLQLTITVKKQKETVRLSETGR